MKILHLNSYYIDNKLYGVLYKKLDKRCDQSVFIPIKYNREPGNEVLLQRGALYFRKIISRFHKYHYRKKLQRCFKELEGLKLMENTDFIHAHNLFCDGALAYMVNEKYGVDYVVSVRHTDFALQYRFMIQRRAFIHKVLLRATKVIFISHQSRNALFAMLPERIAQQIRDKSIILPNGLDDYWIHRITPKRTLNKRATFRLLLVGRIVPIKNINLVIDAVKTLRAKGLLNVHLTIVGGMNVGYESYYKRFLRKIEGDRCIAYLDQINDKDLLLDIYRNADAFILPSKAELFGIAYLEALSQGLPIIYASDCGIASFVKDQQVGISVTSPDVEALCHAVLELVKRYDDMCISKHFIESFDWEVVSDRLFQYYGGNSIVKREPILVS
ncbi:glycosyltransferase [Robertkochia sediminum]|uniref:glycosyltransferase n=1 Tax=Robertkochia sediminum TaxID=2785326 RepID=UPI001934523F|nr:glycosyltransferase [Robertkochia sediminum]MBL7473720.1 glycosyltransferase [Robertkochia sediminum]